MRVRRDGPSERRVARTTDDPAVEGAFRELRATVASLKGQVEAARSATKKAPAEKRRPTPWERFQGFYVIAAPVVSLLMGVTYALWKSDVGYPWPGESFWQDDHVQTALGASLGGVGAYMMMRPLVGGLLLGTAGCLLFWLLFQ